uniref:uncharacterized protein LOC105351415 n=1 Tax=Fragaria vesca subsp. vesca TaxID=101020 RepID=UPI0005C8E3E1|nr:PREDICTED: uncharacterized protein LOC105351415 [Fragaria vesca subsp. vesca]
MYAEMNYLQLKETDTSKLPDKSPAERIGDLAPRTKVVLEKHLTEKLVEVSITRKESFSPRDPKAELSGKLVGKRSQRKVELSDKCETKRSKLQDSRTAESNVSEAVSQKHLTECIFEEFGKKIRPYGEVSDKVEGKMTIVEVDGSLTDPGKVINSKDNPALTPAAHTLNNNNSLMSQKENSNVGRKTRKKEKFNLPCRSSKRLAGQQPEPVNYLVSTVQACAAAARKSSKGRLDAGLGSDDLENRASTHTYTEVNFALQGVPLPKVKSPLEGHGLQPVISLGSDEPTHQLATRDSSGGDASRDAGTGSGNFVNGAPLHVGASSEAEDFFNTLEDINSTSHDSLNSDIMLLDDQVVSKEQQTEENLEMLSFHFRDDPCIDFAYKILTGELPISYEPNLQHAADMVQKEKPVATGSCSKNATAKACSSKGIQAVDLAHEASHQYEAIQEKKAVNDPCTMTDSSGHEESLNKIEKSLENQTAAEEKPQILESEKASVENPDEEFSFPIPETWPDSDPFFGLAVQSLREDDMFRGYFHQNHDAIYNEVNTPAPPVFFECDITPQFDTTGAYVPVFPENSYWPPAENVNQPLSMNYSSQPAGNEGFSNGSGVGSDQQVSMNSSSLPAGNMALPNSSGVATKKPCLKGKQKE